MSAKHPEIGDIWRYFRQDEEFYFLIAKHEFIQGASFFKLIPLNKDPGWRIAPLEYLNRSIHWSYIA